MYQVLFFFIHNNIRESLCRLLSHSSCFLHCVQVSSPSEEGVVKLILLYLMTTYYVTTTFQISYFLTETKE